MKYCVLCYKSNSRCWYAGPTCSTCYKQAHRIQRNIQNRKYKKAHREQLKKYQKIYRQKNMANILKANSIYRRKNIKNDTISRIRKSISSLINIALKKQKTFKANKSISKYLLYTMEELKEHLEKQFESWMNWNNYGRYSIKTWKDDDQSTWTWQLDHIIPQSNFNYLSMTDPEFKDCWELKNLRPYSSKQNVLDGNRR